jgi:hypothetical protein
MMADIAVDSTAASKANILTDNMGTAITEDAIDITVINDLTVITLHIVHTAGTIIERDKGVRLPRRAQTP